MQHAWSVHQDIAGDGLQRVQIAPYLAMSSACHGGALLTGSSNYYWHFSLENLKSSVYLFLSATIGLDN